MTFNELKENYWQKDAAVSKLTIDTDLLLREIRRNKTGFESLIFWRDFSEVSTAVAMVGYFVREAVKSNGNFWQAAAYVVLALSLFFVGSFFVIDRYHQRKKRLPRTEPLRDCIESSLSQIKHQIRLLTNVFWWYLLPPGIGMIMVLTVRYMQKFHALPAAQVLPQFLYDTIGTVLVFWGILYINKWYVNTRLVPRKVELEAMEKSITNDKAL